MELILWRHAEAEAGEPGQADITRALTSKGRKQAAKMADWLDRHLPETCRILVSPAKRTLQTMEPLKRKFKVHADLAPEASAEQILAAANWPDSREPVLIVGHQPTLGEVAARLIGGAEQPWTIRKGNVWWIAQRTGDDDEPEVYVRAVVSPDLLSK